MIALSQLVLRAPAARSVCGVRLATLRGALQGAIGAALCFSVVAAHAAPPQPAPVPSRWQLDIRPGPLRVTTVNVPDRGPRAFFYFTYEVVNNTGQDLLFAPSFELATDDGELLRSGRNVPAAVVRTIMDRLENPYLEDEIRIIGILQQGRENARDGLVIWPAEDLDVDEVKVFAKGFSGETRTVTRPDNGEEVVLYKVLMLTHTVPGNIAGRGSAPLERVEERWILR